MISDNFRHLLDLKTYITYIKSYLNIVFKSLGFIDNGGK